MALRTNQPVLQVVLGGLSLAAWSYLVVGRGRFWRSGPVLRAAQAFPRRVTVVVPARDEAEHIGATLRSLLAQQYGGELRVLLVDDNSNDGTGPLAQELAQSDDRLRVIQGAPLPQGWTGKLWAVQQGLRQPESLAAEYILLTDADIVHGPRHIAALVAWAEVHQLDLVSEMVRLRTESLAERALIPAFVFFFQMLYPFALVNDPLRSEAAAAGGTMLVARTALERIGGIACVRGELIDDVALASAVKRAGHPIWLGHADQAWSERSYPGLADVWSMVARTAYVQLRHSPVLLAGTLAGLWLLYLQPPMLVIRGRGVGRWLGVASWAAMATSFQPTLRCYRQSPLWGPLLPVIACFYMGATVASAVRHHRGSGGDWKGRTYA